MSFKLQPFPSSYVLLLAISLLYSGAVRSELITLKMDNDLEATAELLRGQSGSKAILILHGFLQTRNFFTVRRLGEALHDLGFTVLLPNLTLGINHRRQSLACEAIHTHSMEQDVREVGHWVEWLQQFSHSRIALIGHSAGSLLSLAYLASRPSAPVDQALLVSLIPFAQGPIAKESDADIRRAVEQLALASDEMLNFHLAFCDEYVTTSGNYLSYLAWNKDKTLAALNKMAIKPMIVLGSKDQRLGDDWMPLLKQAGMYVVEIEGANHFFDHEYEFDLTDTIAALLQTAEQ
jgi:pimeloyl-ACP methyl ester carboxylesterase